MTGALTCVGLVASANETDAAGQSQLMADGELQWKWQPVGESNPSYLVENQVS